MYIQHPKIRVGTKQGYLGNELYLAMTGKGKEKEKTVAEGVPAFAMPPEHQRETYADHDLDFLAIGFAGNILSKHILSVHLLISCFVLQR